MFAAVALFVTPVLLFVIAFLIETYLSFKRILKPKSKLRNGYVTATWEFTHTLLVFAVVMLIMLFTQTLDALASAIFLSTFLAATALGVRAVLYIYIFYVQKKPTQSWIDWTFACTHVIAAALLVVTVVKALWYLYKNNPPVNTQFLPYFIPGLVVVLAVCAVPILTIYSSRD